MDFYIIILLSLATLFPKSISSQNNLLYNNNCCKKLPFGCILNTSYPFYDDFVRPEFCEYQSGSIETGCNRRDIPLIFTISNQNKYYVSDPELDHYDNNNNITVDSKNKWTGSGPSSLANTTSLDFSKLKLSSADPNVTFIISYCFQSSNNNDDAISSNASSVETTSCSLGRNGSAGGYYLSQAMLERYNSNKAQICKSGYFLPSLQAPEPIDKRVLISAFKAGFELGMVAENEACSRCVKTGGECGHDWHTDKLIRHRTPQLPGDDGKKKTLLLRASLASTIGIVTLGFLICFCKRIVQKCKRVPQSKSVQDCLKNYASLVPKRYTYSKIKRITKSFTEKLGEGGYGTVFKGSLQDGRVVAVKLWKQTKSDGEEFVNEVMSISRTSHVNVVSLLGFCFEGHKRALVYEFMPHGSLEKFVHGRNTFDESNQSLSSEKLLDIIIGIARGLEYLHRGCNTRIVHFDIKPHNILLDSDFTPKISDFGLAKSFRQEESIINVSGVRGTAGYIAPEVFFRAYGEVSHKSDVYSFGMMVLEMVGCKRRASNLNLENSSETYFPQWVYKRLERGATLDRERVLSEADKELERKMTVVGLWCIQTNPLSRPSMSGVMEMLQGKVDLLEIPPMPSLASPPREHHHQPTNEESVNVLSASTLYART